MGQSTWGFSVCVSSEAATCSSLSSLLPSLWPSRPRPIPSTATTELSHTPTAMPSLVFPSVLPLVWTPSPRVLTQGALPVAHYYGKRSADAEADPYYLGGYALPYAGHAVVAGVPFGSSTGLDPITQGLDASTQGYAPYAYGHLGHYYGKRSADPYYLGGYAGLALPYAAHGVVAAAVPFGSSTGLDPITQGLDASTQGYAPYAYGHLGHYYG